MLLCLETLLMLLVELSLVLQLIARVSNLLKLGELMFLVANSTLLSGLSEAWAWMTPCQTVTCFKSEISLPGLVRCVLQWLDPAFPGQGEQPLLLVPSLTQWGIQDLGAWARKSCCSTCWGHGQILELDGDVDIEEQACSDYLFEPVGLLTQHLKLLSQLSGDAGQESCSYTSWRIANQSVLTISPVFSCSHQFKQRSIIY